MVRARRSAGPTTCLSCSRSTSVCPIVASMPGMRFVKVRLRIAPHGPHRYCFRSKDHAESRPGPLRDDRGHGWKMAGTRLRPLGVASAERQENCAGSPLLPADAYGRRGCSPLPLTASHVGEDPYFPGAREWARDAAPLTPVDGRVVHAPAVRTRTPDVPPATVRHPPPTGRVPCGCPPTPSCRRLAP